MPKRLVTPYRFRVVSLCDRIHAAHRTSCSLDLRIRATEVRLPTLYLLGLAAPLYAMSVHAMNAYRA
jgi:hypothetical protein